VLLSAANRRCKKAALFEPIGDCDTAKGRRIEAPRFAQCLAERIRPALARLGAMPAAGTALCELARLAGNEPLPV